MTHDLVIGRLRLGPYWNFCYVVGSRAGGEAVVIDPAWDVPAILQQAAGAGLRISAAIVTHAHHDHAHSLDELVRATGAAVLVHRREADALREMYGGSFTEVAHEDAWQAGSLSLRLLHTPGHTPGSQSVLVDGALFTGDTLMVGGLGRIGAEPEAAEALWGTVRGVLAALPDDTVIHPGHDAGPHPTSTLGEERARNPALTAASWGEFLRRITGG